MKLWHDGTETWTWNIFSKYRTVLLGCAILGITFCHLDLAQISNGLEVSKLANIFHVFTSFVDVFMFLSGLGLYYSMRKNPGRSYLDWLKRRVIRIVPLYIIISGVTYMIWDILLKHGTIEQVLNDMFFMSWITSGSTKYWFVLAILVFYAIFPSVYNFLYKDNGGEIYRLIILLTSYIVVTGILHHYFAWYETFQIAIERFPVFVIGIYCGKLSYENMKLPEWLIVIISVGAVISTILMYGSNIVSAWIYNTHYAYYFNRMLLGLWMCFSIIFTLKVLKELCFAFWKVVYSIFAYLGGITLEIYLLHQSYLIIFDFSFEWYVLVAVMLPIATASLIHLVEKRYEKRGKQI